MNDFFGRHCKGEYLVIDRLLPKSLLANLLDENPHIESISEVDGLKRIELGIRDWYAVGVYRCVMLPSGVSDGVLAIEHILQAIKRMLGDRQEVKQFDGAPWLGRRPA